MLEQFKQMLQESELSQDFVEANDYIDYDGEKIEVVVITVPNKEMGTSVRAIFHRGMEFLISLDAVRL